MEGGKGWREGMEGRERREWREGREGRKEEREGREEIGERERGKGVREGDTEGWKKGPKRERERREGEEREEREEREEKEQHQTRRSVRHNRDLLVQVFRYCVTKKFLKFLVAHENTIYKERHLAIISVGGNTVKF